MHAFLSGYTWCIMHSTRFYRVIDKVRFEPEAVYIFITQQVVDLAQAAYMTRKLNDVELIMASCE